MSSTNIHVHGKPNLDTVHTCLWPLGNFSPLKAGAETKHDRGRGKNDGAILQLREV